MASGIDYNLLQNQPKNWKFEYDGSTKEIKVSYMSKYFAANENDIKWIFVQKNLPQNERDKVLVYFAHFVKSISTRNKASGGLKGIVLNIKHNANMVYNNQLKRDCKMVLIRLFDGREVWVWKDIKVLNKK